VASARALMTRHAPLRGPRRANYFERVPDDEHARRANAVANGICVVDHPEPIALARRDAPGLVNEPKRLIVRLQASDCEVELSAVAVDEPGAVKRIAVQLKDAGHEAAL
jgi:hypothetical protein